MSDATDARLAVDPLALTLLALLSEQPRHAYALQRLVRERHKDFALPHIRGLYRTVDRLAQTELIEPAELQREGKRPERTVYRLTQEGAAAFRSALLSMLTTPVDEHPSFSVAIGLLAYLPVQEALNALDVRRIALEAAIAQLEVQERGLRGILPRLLLLEVEYVLALRQAELVWVQSVVEDLRTGQLSWDVEQLLAMLSRPTLSGERGVSMP
jgi:DNA-binding PadR family transcriptional regulator